MSGSTLRVSAFLVGLLALVDASSNLVDAQTPAERNQSLRLFRRAQRDYRDGRFLDAATRLERAYELFPEPILLYNLGRAYDGGGRLEDARSAYARFVEDPRSNPEDVRAAHARLVVLEGLIASLHRTEQPEHDPSAGEESIERVAEAGETGALVELETPGEPCVGEGCGVAPEPEPDERPSRVMPIVLLSSGAAVAAAGLGLQLRATRMIDAGTSQERANELGERRRLLAIGGIAALGVAGALAVGGVIAFVVGGSDDDAPVVSIGLGSVHVRGAF